MTTIWRHKAETGEDYIVEDMPVDVDNHADL